MLNGRSMSYLTHIPVTFTSAANISEYRIYFVCFPWNLLLLTICWCCFSSWKVVKGSRSWFTHTSIHLSKTKYFQRLWTCYGIIWLFNKTVHIAGPWARKRVLFREKLRQPWKEDLTLIFFGINMWENYKCFNSYAWTSFYLSMKLRTMLAPLQAVRNLGYESYI